MSKSRRAVGEPLGRRFRGEGLRQAEVEHLRHDTARVALQKDVLRLQVAMDEPWPCAALRAAQTPRRICSVSAR